MLMLTAMPMMMVMGWLRVISVKMLLVVIMVGLMMVMMKLMMVTLML